MPAKSNDLLDKCGRILLFIFGGLLLPISVFLGLAHAPAQGQVNILFVNANAAGANNGSSWGDAYTSLQDALEDAESNGADEIWVATGVYYPDEGQNQSNDDRASTFQLIDGVEIYGGFAGDETTLSERDWESNVTVLSGDIDHETSPDDVDASGVLTKTANTRGDNAYHVVTGSGTDGSAKLDGFSITAGNANGSFGSPCGSACGGGMYNHGGSLTLVNVSFIGNQAISRGGGMYSGGNGNPTLTNISFIGSEADYGGGMYNLGNPVLTNVTFSGNQAGVTGGGMFNDLLNNPTLTNVTFSGNSAGNLGGGMYNSQDSFVTIQNSIFWNNQADGSISTAAASIVDDSFATTIRYSLVQGWNPAGAGNLDGTDPNNDPLFVTEANPADAPTAEGNLRLRPNSPVIDAGDNDADLDGAGSGTAKIADVSDDLDGNPRLRDSDGDGTATVDMGAYEFQIECEGVGSRIFVDRDATGGAGDGSAWSDAFLNLQDALLTASVCGGVDEIWVAEGVYYPDEGYNQSNDDRESPFRMPDAVALYGGFAGTETSLDERNWETNVTVLSGDVDHETAPDITDPNGVITDPMGGVEGNNAYTVVTASGTGSDAVLDGFAITGGSSIDADISDPLAGGMVNAEGSPSLANLMFSGNIGQVGAMTNVTNSSPSLTNVTFSHNFGLAGGMLSLESNPTLTDVTFSRNFGIIGAMLFLESEATLTDVTVVENEAAVEGGGIVNLLSVLTINNSRIISNSVSEGGGGGIYNAGGVVTMNGSRVEGNVTSDGDSGNGNQGVDGGDGGGILNAGILTVTESIIARNHTGNGAYGPSGSGNGGFGGGIYNSGYLTITTSLIAENQTGDGGAADPIGGAGGSGGGIYNDSGSVAIVDSSIISNSTGVSPPLMSLQANGGGLANNRGTLRLVNSTISGNEAEGHGGGLFETALRTSYLYNVTVSENRADANEDDTGDGGGVYSSGSVYLYNSILAGNSDGSSQLVHPDCSFDSFLGGMIEAAQYNLIGDESGCDGLFENDPGNDIEGNLVGLDPELTALGDYGGHTLTHALYGTSPARDAGNPDGCLDPDGDPLTTDQRGEPRPETAGGRCDMGAVEYQLPAIGVDVSPASVIEDSGGALTVTFTRTVNTLGVTTATFDVGGTDTFNADYVQSGADSFDGNGGDVTFNDGEVNRTLLITPTVDAIVEADETVVITLTASVDYELGLPDAATATILDDDGAGVVVSPTAGLTTTEAGGTDTFTVTLLSEPADTVTVNLSSGNPTEGTVNSTELTFDATNWQTAQIVTVTGVDDDVDDGDQPYTIVTSVSSEDPEYDGIAIADVNVTNVDDDAVYSLYLPVAFGLPLGPPDLVVDSLTVEEGQLSVVVANVGEGPVLDTFWVDVYIDPETPPTGVNDVWWRVGEEGLVWGVTADALPLEGGETLTLTLNDAYFVPEESEFGSEIPAGTVLYAQVDSAHTGSEYGGVLETHEVDDGPYNNIIGPLVVPEIITTQPGTDHPALTRNTLPPRR